MEREERYIGQEVKDLVRRFVESECEVLKGGRVRYPDLYAAFRGWREREVGPGGPEVPTWALVAHVSRLCKAERVRSNGFHCLDGLSVRGVLPLRVGRPKNSCPST